MENPEESSPHYSKALSVDDDEKRATKPIVAPPSPPMPAAAAEKQLPATPIGPPTDYR
ncbi:unnamed protein product [Camellia sinensis]